MSHTCCDFRLNHHGAIKVLLVVAAIAVANRPVSGAAEELVPANFGNGFVGLASLGQIIAEQMNVDRKATVYLVNHSKHELTHPKTYFYSGGSVSLPPKVPVGEGVVFGVKKSDNASYGVVGVVTYDIQNSNFRLAICFSVPYDQLSYENWFKIQIINKNTPTDKSLYEDMYYNYHQKTLGDIARAADGYASWRNGFLMEGAMGNAGTCELKLRISELQ